MGDISNFEYDTISIFFSKNLDISIFFDITKLITILCLKYRYIEFGRYFDWLHWTIVFCFVLFIGFQIWSHTLCVCVFCSFLGDYMKRSKYRYVLTCFDTITKISIFDISPTTTCCPCHHHLSLSQSGVSVFGLNCARLAPYGTYHILCDFVRFFQRAKCSIEA